MSISPARRIAFEVLKRVATQGAYADDVLRAELAENIQTADAGLATELSLGVLRWQRLLDFLIDRHLTKASKTLDIEVRIALRLGIYQLWFLQRVPAHAAVNESVELVKRARKRSAAPLVNAILRKATQEADQAGRSRNAISRLLSPDLPLDERLGTLYSHPTWLVTRWLHNFGQERTLALLETNNRIPTLSANVLDPDRREQALESLKQAGCSVEPGALLQDAWTVRGGNPPASDAVRNGWVFIQDEASQTVPYLLDVRAGNSVLDLCAAPGGKTLLLALLAGITGHVTAADIHAHRVRAMQERFERSGIRNVTCVTTNGTQPLAFERRFDRILVDVPCSGTGTLARHPEIRWRLVPEDLTDLHGRQVRLLRNALTALTPGGRLVYSTCSLEPEENELVVTEALRAAGNQFRIVSPREPLAAVLRADIPIDRVVTADGFFRTDPATSKTDGFFGATIEYQT